jgi:hypothetical protein
MSSGRVTEIGGVWDKAEESKMPIPCLGRSLNV